jgi:hypothetical protein
MYDSTDEVRTCTTCKGTGKTSYDSTRVCYACGGVPEVHGFSASAVLDMVLTGKPDSANRKFRSAWPSKWNPWRTKDPVVRRAYYIWRVARFDGGADVCLPMTADDVTRGDPFKTELNLFAKVIAKKVFGSHMAGAYRWSGLLVGDLGPKPEGLPASAYENGPVVASGTKPDFELGEL